MICLTLGTGLGRGFIPGGGITTERDELLIPVKEMVCQRAMKSSLVSAAALLWKSIG